jgi:hypothetical protein
MFTPTIAIYLVIGLGVAVAIFLSDRFRTPGERWSAVAAAVPFWPLYVPFLLSGRPTAPDPPPAARDEMATVISQVEAELQAALDSLDGWAEGVLAREKDRLGELRAAWTVQAARIREMDRLLTSPTDANVPPGPDNERLRHCLEARRQNLERLRQVRRRAYEDLMGTLAWVRELVSMIHLAKFTGAPAARAEELVAQIAAAVEGLSAAAWARDDALNIV